MSREPIKDWRRRTHKSGKDLLKKKIKEETYIHSHVLKTFQINSMVHTFIPATKCFIKNIKQMDAKAKFASRFCCNKISDIYLTISLCLSIIPTALSISATVSNPTHSMF